MPFPQQWQLWAAEHVGRTRAVAIAAADELEAALNVQHIVNSTVAPLGPTASISWDDLLNAQPSTLDRVDLEAKIARLVGADPHDPHIDTTSPQEGITQ